MRWLRRLFRSPRDRALLVGINEYPGSPLRGCVNDVLGMEGILRGIGFSSIKMLLDGDARASAIRRALDWLVDDAKPGDRRFFQFSGHGTRFPDASEEDGLAEVICPVDFAWTPKTMISDEEILLKLDRAACANVAWVSDSCHSAGLGSSERSVQRSRYLPPPEWTLVRSWPKRVRGVRGMVFAGQFAAACQSDQTASDTIIRGKPCGAFSWFLQDELKRDMARSFADLVNSCANRLASSGYLQVPEAIGLAASRAFLK